MDKSFDLSSFGFGSWFLFCQNVFKGKKKRIKNLALLSKRPITILEVLVAVALSALIITTLLSFFSQVTKIEQKMEMASFEIQRRENVQVRCQHIFSSLVSESTSPEDSSRFYTPSVKESPKEGLKVIFNHGIDPDPLYSGPVRAYFYLDQDHNFVVDISPLEKEKQQLIRKEILWTKVKKVQMEFFALQDKNYKFQPKWPKTKKDIPPMIKITIEDEKASGKEFAFFLPSSHAAINYSEQRSSQ